MHEAHYMTAWIGTGTRTIPKHEVFQFFWQMETDGEDEPNVTLKEGSLILHQFTQCSLATLSLRILVLYGISQSFGSSLCKVQT